MWFHDIASRGHDNVAGRTISRLALTITRVGTIPRPGHDIVGKPTILPRGPAISRAKDDIAPRENDIAHTRDIAIAGTISYSRADIVDGLTISYHHDIVSPPTIS